MEKMEVWVCEVCEERRCGCVRCVKSGARCRGT